MNNVTAVPATSIKRKERDEDESSDEGSDVSMINVDFDFYNPNPEVDDIALKRLLRQLLSSDSDLFDIHSIAQHVLAAAKDMGVGTTVKTDGTESDPYAYLSLVDVSDVNSKPALKPLLEYLISQTPQSSLGHQLLSSTASSDPPNRIALVISERLVNLPVQLMPPVWKMTFEEMEAAKNEGKTGMDFTHYLLFSRVYKMDVGDEDMDSAMPESAISSQPAAKKSKKAKKEQAATGILHYHPEEEFLEKSALFTHTFPFKTSQPRNEESFGVEQRGRLSIYEAGKIKEGIAAMEAACGQ